MPPFHKIIAPIMLQYAYGADGIIILREPFLKEGNVLCRQKLYENSKFFNGGADTCFSTFEENQFSSILHSIGPQGSIMPYATSSDNWKSLVDTDGKGILCFFDEFYVAEFVDMEGSKDDTTPIGKYYFTTVSEIRFRPRQIKNNDLLRIMIERQCTRPCTNTPLPNWWPNCLTDCSAIKELPPIKDADVVDTADYTDRDGNTIKGSELKKHPIQRTGYKNPCVPVCQSTAKAEYVDSVSHLLSILDKYYNYLKKFASVLENDPLHDADLIKRLYTGLDSTYQLLQIAIRKKSLRDIKTMFVTALINDMPNYFATDGDPKRGFDDNYFAVSKRWTFNLDALANVLPMMLYTRVLDHHRSYPLNFDYEYEVEANGDAYRNSKNYEAMTTKAIAMIVLKTSTVKPKYFLNLIAVIYGRALDADVMRLDPVPYTAKLNRNYIPILQDQYEPTDSPVKQPPATNTSADECMEEDTQSQTASGSGQSDTITTEPGQAPV